MPARVLLPAPDAGPRQGLDLGGLRWPTVLRCGQVVLRPLHRRDASRYLLVRERNRHWTGPWDGTVPTTSTQAGGARDATSRREVHTMVRRLDSEARDGRCLPFALCLDPGWPRRPTPPGRLRLAGQVTVSGITLGSGRFAHVGYWIDEQLAGRGIMPVAVGLAIDHCLRVRELHRVEVCIRPENARSLRVVQKLGLRPEGLRERYLHIDGDWRDHLVFVADTGDLPDGVLPGRLASLRTC